MNFINESILEYSLKNSSEESELLKKLRKETNQKILHPRMLSGKLQGRLLSLISLPGVKLHHRPSLMTI